MLFSEKIAETPPRAENDIGYESELHYANYFYSMEFFLWEWRTISKKWKYSTAKKDEHFFLSDNIICTTLLKWPINSFIFLNK